MLDPNKTPAELFRDSLGKEELFLFRGPFSPNLMWLRWTWTKGMPYRYQVEIQMYGVLDGNESTMLTSLDGYQSFSKRVFLEYWKGDVTLGEIQQDHDKRYSNIDGFYSMYTADYLRALDDQTIAAKSDEVQMNFSMLAAETIFIEQFDQAIALSILGEDKKTWLENIWDKAVDSHFESFETRRNKAILSTLDQYSLDEAIEKVAYIYTDYWQPKSREAIKEILEKFERATIAEEIEANEKEMAHKAEVFHTWYETLDTEQKKFVDYVQYIMNARDLRKDPIAKIQYCEYLLAREISTRIGLDLSYSYLITPLDMPQGVEKLRAMKEEIMGRKNGVEIYMAASDDYIIRNCDPKVVYKELEQKVPGYVVEVKDIIKGQIASKGKVIGKVRVVMDPHSAVFNDGDILVTSMTRPEFVPLMKKAGAVVTNEGGITCHAAIVSRELKVPCIIGTKFATQVLKDGDIVEVDADSGIVTIIT